MRPSSRKAKGAKRPWLLVVMVVLMVAAVTLVATLGVNMLAKPAPTTITQPPRRALGRTVETRSITQRKLERQHQNRMRKGMPKAEGLLAKGQGIDAATLRARREAQEMMFEAKRMMAEAQAGKAAREDAAAPEAASGEPVYPVDDDGAASGVREEQHVHDVQDEHEVPMEELAAEGEPLLDDQPVPVTAVSADKEGVEDPFGDHSDEPEVMTFAKVGAAEKKAPAPISAPVRKRSVPSARLHRGAGGGDVVTSDDPLPPCPPFDACSDTCEHANNGRCDDGSDLYSSPHDGSIHPVKCDLGTDCTDCGELPKGMKPFQEPRTVESCAPVAHSVESGVVMYSAWTKTKPAFLQPFTDNKKDVDVSDKMYHSRVLEGRITHTWGAVTRECCANGGLVVDVGVNFGYFALYSAALGCEVVGWEPVPRFRAFIRYGVTVNNFTGRVHVRPAAAGKTTGGHVQITVPQAGIWGTAGVDGMNVDNAIPDPEQYKIQVPIESVGEVVDREYAGRDICLLKLDVEGYEPEAMEGMWNLFEQKRVRHFMMEYTPGVYERSARWKDYWKPPAMLAQLNLYGYTVRSMGNKDVRPGPEEGGWDAPVPVMEVLDPETIRYDLLDAARAWYGRLGPIPHGLHPWSFHGQFGHNTDIWAARDNLEEYGNAPMPRVGPTTPLGLGGRSCRDLVHYKAPMAEIKGNLCHEDPRERKKAVEDAISNRRMAGENYLKELKWAKELLGSEILTWGVPEGDPRLDKDPLSDRIVGR